MEMSLDVTLELDFDEDKKETCADMELQEFPGSSLGEVLLASSDPKQSEDNKGFSETCTAEAFPSAAGEMKNGSFVDEMEEGETVDNVDYGDVEDGEIGGLPDSEFLKKFSCRFYRKGKCGWGKDCRFFHLSDKGLYSMFDEPVRNKDITFNMSRIQEPNYFCYPPPSSEVLYGWDKALMEVKDLIKQSKAKKEEECFEEKKLYMTIENDGVPIDRFRKSFRKEKKAMPESARKRQVRPIEPPSLPNKPEKSKSEPEGANLKSSRTDTIKNSTYHSEWKDPWRRSKTPPNRKRFHSKSLTNSSKSSICSCESTSESSSKCLNRSPKRVRHRSNRSRSKSFRRNRRARKESSRKSGRRSSSSSSKISSHSDSSSDFVRRVRKRSRKHRTSSRSPTPRRYKRKKSSRKAAPSHRRRSRSISDVVLPFHASRKMSWERAITVRKESHSVSHSLSPLQPSRQTQSVEKKHSDHSPEKVQRSPSRSSSSSHLSAAKPEAVLSNCCLSCSDMSISPLSYSSMELNPAAIGNTTFHSRELIPDTCSIGALPVSASTPKRGSTGFAFKSSAAPRKTQTTKALSALEMQLNRYRSDRGISSSERAQGPLASAKSKVLDSPASKDKRIAKSSGSAKKKFPKEMAASNATSKREMLLKQLRCVEEAIARKKQCMKN